MSVRRRITSLFMLGTFVVLSVSGLMSYFTEYTRGIATVHTVFGILFTFFGLVHLINNIKPIKNYVQQWSFFLLLSGLALVGFLSYSEVPTIKAFMDLGARSKAKIGLSDESAGYTKIKMGFDNGNQLSIDIKRAQHFWHPQIAIWTEDKNGDYLETLFVTKATAKGIFAGGRSKENFKTLDAEQIEKEDAYRRVNALPVWSHKRAVRYEDGLYAPTYENPLPDAMSGATPLGNFSFETSVEYMDTFVVKFEINVAFDDNEYYSEYDFPDDEIFHNGTGQLGQPSIIFASTVDPEVSDYQIMNLQGHGHYSAQNGTIYDDLSKLTTALEIVDYAVLGYKKLKI